MTLAGIVIGFWFAIAGVAFLAISGLGRLAARGDIDADLAIVRDTELRMLLGERHAVEPRSALAGWVLADDGRQAI